MVGALIGKGLCDLGIHKVDCWTYRHSSKLKWCSTWNYHEYLAMRCIQDGVCQRCGAKRDRVHHDWPVNFPFGSDCRRCGEYSSE